MSINIYDFWFARVEIANNIKLKLLNQFSSEEIWKFSKQELIDLKLKTNTIDKILNINYKMNLEKYNVYMDKNKIYLFSYKDEYYPYKLKYILDKPAYIFVRRKFRCII